MKAMKKEADKKSLKAKVLVPTFILIVLVAYVIWVLSAAIPRINPVMAYTSNSSLAPLNALSYPGYGQSAVGISNLGVAGSSGLQKPVPMASTAKLIAALIVLQKYPLALGQSGPSITVSASDVALYNQYQAVGGSDLVVSGGEQLSEYQMLEAMLLPSADNIADSLAIWAFGSLTNYSTYANQYLRTNNLLDTHIGTDASGYNPSSTSTAHDLVKIGQLTMNNPVLTQIVAKPYATGIPIVGTIKNVDSLVGQSNIVGIKTGNTDQAGGVFISASKVTVNGQPMLVYTAIMQAPSLYDALHSSLPLITSSQSNFTAPVSITSIKTGTVVGKYYVPWSKQYIDAVASQPISLVTWGGTKMSITTKLNSINYNYQPNQIVGALVATTSYLNNSAGSPVLLTSSPGKPSKIWVLLHPSSVVHL